ncbi:MAG: amylo-alpha-1,6-glucosidase, partial [Candidatus Limnocylindrales bacterium]
FALDGSRPVWTFGIGDVRLEKRVWMAYGQNTTFVRYALAPGSAPRSVALELTPLVTWRDHHAVGSAFEPRPRSAILEATQGAVGLSVRFPDAPVELQMRLDGDAAEPAADWYYGISHREETARGLRDREDLLAVGRLRGTVGPDTPLTLVLTTETTIPVSGDAALDAAAGRDASLIALAGAPLSPVVRDLVLAADAFIVNRRIPDADGGRDGRSIIAGYPWFNDWGRDTMIALPGLCLATGRHGEARTILRSFARFVEDGLLPNNFPDVAGEEPGRNTVDASLWYPHAVLAYFRETGDATLVDELLPTLRDILDHHLSGTRYGIAADRDGLLRAGVTGVQLTWMDARVGDRVITPRIGKPVEIQALWISALRSVGDWCRQRGDAGGDRYLKVARLANTAFLERFWQPELGYLADVVDGPDGDDLSLRPNQLLALSIPEGPLVDSTIAASILDVVGRKLETPVGLRTLGPDDPSFAGRYGGGPAFRDGVYHQGTAWAWLAGPYVDALVRFGGPSGLERARSVLDGLHRHLRDAGLGSVSEIFDGDPPFAPQGCPWQAWSVAEVLRSWRLVTGE